MTLVISALAELKFFYIEFIVILIVASLLTSFSYRKLIIIVGAAIGFIFGTAFLVRLYPIFSGVFELEGLIENATSVGGYTGIGDMNRFTGIPMVNELFFDNMSERLFGFGLGNCDYADSYAFLTTPFFSKYSGYHYTWLSAVWMYLETGAIGLIMFMGFFVLVALFALVRMKKQKEYRHVYQITFILSLCCILIAIYNASLRTESAFLIYTVLSMAFWKSHKAVNDERIKAD